MLRTLSVELQKWRRTWFLLVTVAAALAAPFLNFLVFALGDRDTTWHAFAQQTLMFQMLMTGPLIATLIGAQMIATEYQYDTWKLSLTAPVSRWSVYLTKWLVGTVWIIALTVLDLGASLLAAQVLGVPLNEPFGTWLLAHAVAGLVLSAMIPVYHLITLVTRSFFVTSGVGIVATFAGLVVINSKYQAIFPTSGNFVLTGYLLGQTPSPLVVGTLPLWIGIQVAIALVGTVLSTLYVQKADYR